MLPRTAQAHTPLRTSKSRRTWCGPYAAAVFMRQHYDAAYEVCLVSHVSRQDQKQA